MPKSPIWQAEVGPCTAEEYFTNDRATHYELRVGKGHQVIVFPHELPALRELIDYIEAHRKAPVLALVKRGSA